MTAESNVGARIFLIGKDGVLAGLKEIQAATARLNAEIAAGAKASKMAAAGSDEQALALARLNAVQDLYQKNLRATTAEQDAVARVGKVAFLTLAAAGAAWTYESIKWAAAYQTQLVALRVQAGLTVSAMNQIGAAAKANSAALGINATQYLQAAYHPASTGMSTRETIAITNNAAKLAAMSGGTATTEDTANALTGVMKSYNLGPNQAARTAATLLAIVGAGNMRFGDLNAALASGVASTASTFGVNLQSLGSALAFATDRGVPAAQAGTRLRMAMSLLGAPSGTSTKFLTAAGLSSSTVSGEEGAMTAALAASGLSVSDLSQEMRRGGIQGALQLLHRDLTSNGVSAAWQAAFLGRAFGGGKMGSAITQMYDNVPGLNQKVTQIGRNSTQAEYAQKWADTQKTLNFQLRQFRSEVHNIGIEFGGTFTPMVADAVHGLTDMLKWLDKNRSVVLALGGAVTAVLVPAMAVALKRAFVSTNGSIMTVVRGYRSLISGQTAEQAALARTDAALATTTGATERLALADQELTGASLTTGGGGVSGLGRGAAGIAGKLGLGAFTASMAMPVLNQLTQKRLQHLVGKGGQAVLGDAAAGALTGMYFGPEGALAGAGIGALYGDRGHLARQLEVGGHDLVHGLDAGRHLIGHSLASAWDDLWGGSSGSSSTASARPLTIHVHSHNYIDGKEVTKSVVKNVMRTASRT